MGFLLLIPQRIKQASSHRDGEIESIFDGDDDDDDDDDLIQ